MAFINDQSLDALLNDVRDNTEELHICTVEPTTFLEATVTYSLGKKTSPAIAAPSDRVGGGREIIVDAITDGEVSADGTAGFWALVKASAATRLLVTGQLDDTQFVTNLNPFTLVSFAVDVPDAIGS